MEQHCFYCHKPGHTRAQCPKLAHQRQKTCYLCGSSQHLIRDCPKSESVTLGQKRQRTAPAHSPRETPGTTTTTESSQLVQPNQPRAIQKLDNSSSLNSDSDLTTECETRPTDAPNKSRIISNAPGAIVSTTEVNSEEQTKDEEQLAETAEDDDDDDDSSYHPPSDDDNDSVSTDGEGSHMSIDEDEKKELLADANQPEVF
ncbi:hypothetical protein G6F37_012832 [Rhizopus arrhizus]|nr:hypothetical protein G6F38_012783 [Rhizopus arrhizus]KAG1141351.1 hypothetical protein G6F37_012832 [Rhizopus arrhizus]